MPLTLQLIILALLILLNGAFALAELALVSARRAMLALMERQHMRGAARAKVLADNPQSFLPTTQFGITLIGILTGAFGGDQLAARLDVPLLTLPYIGHYAGPLSVVLTVLAITFLTLVFGELVPKQLALRQPERLSTLVAGPIALLARAAAPAVWLLGVSTRLVLRLFGPEPEDPRQVSEEELKAILVEGAETGMLETEERDIIERVLRLADKPVRAIMTPRTEIIWIDRTATQADIIAVLHKAPHSRFVVCDRTVDNVTGVVQAKDLLDRALAGKPFTLTEALRRPLAIPDSVTALEALERLKGDQFGMALVLDEYGSFEGIITAADVLEAIVGDSETSGPPAHAPEPPPDTMYELDGMTPVDEAKARLHLPKLPAQGSYHTLAGLILALLLRPAHKGDAILFGGWKFEVLAMDGRRIERVRVVRETGE